LPTSHGRPSFGLALEVAPGHVETDTVAEDVIEGALDRDVGAALAQRHDHLDLVVHVRRLARIGEVAVGHDVVGVLLEEEGRLLGRVVPHLDRMLGIVAADAVDAVHGKQLVAALHRQGGNRRRLHDVACHRERRIHHLTPA
jgi:hypothetical protein